MKTLSESLSKKGQLGGLGTGIITLVIAAVFLILGLIVLQELRDTDVIRTSQSSSVINETHATVNSLTKVVLGGTASPGANSFIVSLVINSTNMAVIPASNYTIDSTAGTIIYSSAGNTMGYNGSRWNVTYSYKHGDSAFSSANTTLVGLGSFSDFWTIIVLAIVISIVIGLLLAVFGGSRKQR